MNNSPVEYLTPSAACDILNSVACLVELHITLTEHTTFPGISTNNTILVTGMGETHIHNIKSIKDPVSGKYVPIHWDE